MDLHIITGVSLLSCTVFEEGGGASLRTKIKREKIEEGRGENSKKRSGGLETYFRGLRHYPHHVITTHGSRGYKGDPFSIPASSSSCHPRGFSVIGE